jgi:hypothetical protein
MPKHARVWVAPLALLLVAAGCHSVVVKPVTVTPAPSVATPRLAIDVDRVGVNRIECMTGEADGCERAHLAVGVKIKNQGSGPTAVRVDDTQLIVNPRPSDPHAARAVDTAASGPGPLLIDFDDRSEAAPVTLEPGASMDAWVDFTGFDGPPDNGYRPRLALAVPYDAGGADKAEVVLADPSAGAPEWQFNPPIVNGMTFGGVWMNVPGRGADQGVPRTDRDIFGFQLGFVLSRRQWTFRSSLTIGALTGSSSSDDNDWGYGFGGQLSRAFSYRTGRSAWLSWAPTVGIQTGQYWDDATPERTAHDTALIGAVAGVSLLFDRDRPSGGALPLPPLAPRFGSVMGVQLLYVHWFGEVLSAPIGWGGAGFMVNGWIGLNLP